MKSKIRIMFLIILFFAIFSPMANADVLDLNYREIFENHKIVRLIIDVETGDIVQVNNEAVLYYGYTHDELLIMNISEVNTLTPEETRNEWEAAAEEERNHFRFQHRLASGEIRDVEVCSYPILHEGKSFLYSIVIDITEAVEAEKREENRENLNYLIFSVFLIAIGWLIFLSKTKEQYKKISNHDQLTKVYSRHYLDEWQSIRTNHNKDMSAIPSLVMLDIDQFKKINDSFGHLIGDQVLVEVANVLKQMVRDNDLVIRYGGDEFILILEKTSQGKSQILMERIKKELLNNSKFDFPIEISYGIVEMKGNVFDAIELADKKMYEMKK